MRLNVKARLATANLLRFAEVPDRLFPDVRLNRVCRPDAWDDPGWLTTSRAMALPQGEGGLHRKPFELTQCIFGLERLGVLGRGTRVLGVGAGHDHALFYLANRCDVVVATDLYRGTFVESPAGEAAPDFLDDPSRYAPFPYRRDRLVAFPADGLALPFRSDWFDVVYSLSSIEHFGGHDAAAQAMREMARVLRPGGVACVATELVVRGPSNDEYFSRDELETYVIRPSELWLIESVDDRPPPERFLDDPIRLPQDTDRTPHLVLGDQDMRWTSVVLFLRKPRRVDLARWTLRGAAHLVRSRRPGAS